MEYLLEQSTEPDVYRAAIRPATFGTGFAAGIIIESTIKFFERDKYAQNPVYESLGAGALGAGAHGIYNLLDGEIDALATGQFGAGMALGSDLTSRYLSD